MGGQVVLYDNPDRIRRLRTLDQLLRSVGLNSQTAFAKEFNVDVRTIYNDLLWLDSNAGSIRQKGRKRFYVDSNCPSPFNLTESQTIAFLLGHTALCQYCGSAFENEARELLDTVLNKILDPDLRARIAELSNAVKFSSQHSVISVDRTTLHTLFSSYLVYRKVRIAYRRPNGIPSERTIHPYTFLNESGEWSLVAFCELRSKILRFKIHRIQSATAIDDTYTVSCEYNSTDFLDEGFDNYCDGITYQFEIEFDEKTSPHIDAHLHHITQELIPLENGNTLLKFESEGLPAVARWVMKYGSGAIVHNPPELIDHITKEINLMQNNYQNRKG